MQPTRSELDAQWQAIDAFADRRHGRRVLSGEQKASAHGPCPLGEQLYGVGFAEGCQGISLLARDVQQLTAGDQHLQPRAGTQQRGDLRSGGDDVLEVVQDQQQVAFRKGVHQLLERFASGLFLEPQRLCYGWQDVPRITDRGQRDEHAAA